ncbi:hypothetical protein Bca4012_010789 [Brassica carinata]
MFVSWLIDAVHTSSKYVTLRLPKAIQLEIHDFRVVVNVANGITAIVLNFIGGLTLISAPLAVRSTD